MIWNITLYETLKLSIKFILRLSNAFPIINVVKYVVVENNIIPRVPYMINAKAAE